MKKCVIIGSGLGGLSTGVILAREGFDVTILEQEAQPGGCLQCFQRRGVKFETGMHFIGSAQRGQTLNRLMRYLEIDDIALQALDTQAYDIVRLGNDEFRFPNGTEAFIEQMSRYFPHEREGIEAYINCVESVAQASSLHTLNLENADSAISTEYQLRSINEVIESHIQDHVLRDVLVGNLPLYAAQRDKTPFSTHAFIVDFYNQSSFRVTGGSDLIGLALQKRLEHHGGHLFTHQKAVKIHDDGQRVTGVTTADGNYYDADIVVSAIHPVPTLAMTDSPLIRPAFRRRMNHLPNTIGIFAVYLHFKEGRMPYLNSNYYGYRPGVSPWDSGEYTLADWPRGYLYMHLCHQAQPRYARAGVILSYMRFEEMAPWVGTEVGHRGADYEQFKRQRAERLIDAVGKAFPTLRDSIEHYYTSTPLTYLNYTGTPEGSAYGIARDISLGVSCHVPQRTKLPGLYLTGQNINSHGILGVLVGTVVTCSDLLGTEYLYQQIIKANL
ncbi:MAG: NAD(P)/FAD-dependent oxidoreductase [Bacteroidales bacterium]|nr:NAD(P)/FAD-dependent oxidoreductase [Bacteroidales bacterium]